MRLLKKRGFAILLAVIIVLVLIYLLVSIASQQINWSYAENLYGYTALTKVRNDSGVSNEVARLNVVGAIDEYSRPAILGLKTSSGSTHFVVGYGYTSDGDIIICDPASRNYTMLSEYFDAGYFVYRIYVYEV